MDNTISNLVKISELLGDGQCHDGTSIGKKCGITRAAVSKVIKKFKEYGVEIQSIKGKGYLLEKPLILLDAKKIKKNIKTLSLIIDILEKVGSTNDYLKNDSDQDNKVKICVAEMQTKGRGRLNRQWHSPFGQNIYFSLRCSFQKDMSELSGLSLVTGLAVCNAITSITHADNLAVKWPNDIFVDQQKIAGILIDIDAGSNGFCNAIIGIGINVNMQNALKKEIDQPWNSLQKITGEYIDRNLLCAELINSLMNYLERFSKSGLSDFINEWKERDCLFGKSVALMSGQKKIMGIGAGINAQGHLALKMPDKTEKTFFSGDATLLK
ncbi:MAG: bifunctional biotin--[acetyl-CoA-carboxylase] ligase/biotin operon repressor BirA [Gammaproteobacteria bacterium]|nr:bifunctional biotin--[acetyl-CoA-carboxylase] ligase/biotin operon repressor BirA [Gammaproteobacteria bacterium]